jgi:hypothetical protein
MCSKIALLTAERQKPHSAKNEAFEVVGKVGETTLLDSILLNKTL